MHRTSCSACSRPRNGRGTSCRWKRRSERMCAACCRAVAASISSRAASSRAAEASTAAPRRRPAARRGQSRIHWDRLGRVALTLVLGAIMISYLNPLIGFVHTYRGSSAAKAHLHQLVLENKALHRRVQSTNDPSVLERAARRQGMIGPSYGANCGSRGRSYVGPVVLLTLGTLFLIQSFDGPGFHRTWPLLLLVIGITKLWESHTSNPEGRDGVPPIPGGPESGGAVSGEVQPPTEVNRG